MQSDGQAGEATGLNVPAGQTPSVRVERKHFTFDLRENPRGKFLRITEEVGGRYDTIIVPVTGLEQFRDALNEVIRLNNSQKP
jgi:hypothetical protein